MKAIDLINSIKESNPKNYRMSVSKIKDAEFLSSVKECTSFLPEDASHYRRLWHLYNNVMFVPRCPICENENTFQRGAIGYTKFCSGSCEIKNKWLKTTDKKKEEIYRKQKQTNLERYGKECTFESESVKRKIKQTFESKYGEGIVNPTQVKEINDKVKASIKKRFGVENPGQTPQAISKRIEVYGVENPFSSKFIQEKIKKTNMERFNAEHPMQNSEIFERATKHRSYTYIASNGKAYVLQGYEKFALEELLKMYKEEDIVYGTSIKRHCEFEYLFNGKTRKYFPDFYVISENKIVEVKSAFSLKYEKEKNSLKRQAVLDKGVNFEFWVYDKKGNRTELNESDI